MEEKKFAHFWDIVQIHFLFNFVGSLSLCGFVCMGNFNWVVGSYTIEKYSGLAILWRPWKGRWWCCPFSLSPPSWRSIEDYTWNYLAPTPAGRRRQMSRGFHSEVRIAQQKLRPHNVLKCYFHSTLSMTVYIYDF